MTHTSAKPNRRRSSDRTPGPDLAYIAPVLRIGDLARSIAFYRDRLGFEVEFHYEGFYASVWRDGCRIHLNRAPPAPRDQAAFEREEYIDVCAGVHDAEELSARFGAAGVEFTVALRRMPYGIEFYVRDPDGYILAFIQPAP
jgi:catechol 2,3-dioxygenase-like lactoylglutathione lyase family enzyme